MYWIRIGQAHKTCSFTIYYNLEKANKSKMKKYLKFLVKEIVPVIMGILIALIINNWNEESEKNGIWTLEAGVFPENKASLKIHQNLGFREIGYREKIGQMDGVWRDTILLERRTKVWGME